MKAITLWNPYPYLIANGFKKNETRGWATSYRGKIAIHSAKKNDNDIEMITRDLIYKLNHRKDIVDVLKMNKEYGCIICTADLVDCIKITQGFVNCTASEELIVGDYTIGRYAWKLENVRMLDNPVPAKGKQRLWEWKE